MRIVRVIRKFLKEHLVRGVGDLIDKYPDEIMPRVDKCADEGHAIEEI